MWGGRFDSIGGGGGEGGEKAGRKKQGVVGVK